MTESKFKFDRSMLRVTLTLLLFSAVVAALLGLTNRVTEEPIQLHKAAKTEAAMRSVLAAEVYEPVDYTGGDATISKLYRAGDAGWVVAVQPSGFGGLIDLIVGVGTDGAVTGVSIVSMSETSGLGANAGRESFRNQYVGKSGSVALRKQGGEIDALTGATVTSTAVTRGVNAALSAVAGLR